MIHSGNTSLNCHATAVNTASKRQTNENRKHIHYFYKIKKKNSNSQTFLEQCCRCVACALCAQIQST